MITFVHGSIGTREPAGLIAKPAKSVVVAVKRTRDGLIRTADQQRLSANQAEQSLPLNAKRVQPVSTKERRSNGKENDEEN